MLLVLLALLSLRVTVPGRLGTHCPSIKSSHLKDLKSWETVMSCV